MSPARRLRGARPLDWAIIAAAAAAVAWSGADAYGSGSRPVLTVSDGSREWLYPLEADRDVPVPGPLGTTVVELRGGSARFLSSPCPNQTCVHAAAISSPGQWSACLPNKVLIRVDGTGDGEAPDAVVR